MVVRTARVVVMLALALVSIGPAAAAPPDRLTPVPLIIAPSHSEELFSTSGGSWGTGPIPVPRGDLLVMAAEFEHRDVQVARFSISSDGGLRWRVFASDRRDEGQRSGNNPNPFEQVYEGDVGYTAHLDTRPLAAGVHILRV